MAASSSTIIPHSSSPVSSVSSISFAIKLTSKNYLAWKTQFIPLLHYQNLMGFIGGSMPSPPLESPEYASWFQKDQMLLSWIISSLSEDTISYVIGLTSAHSAWTALSNASTGEWGISDGDNDGRVPVTSSQYSVKYMNLPIKTQWYPWYLNNEVGGYTQVYRGDLTFATVRGAGHEVPSYQPDRALTLITHFLAGTPLPNA